MSTANTGAGAITARNQHVDTKAGASRTARSEAVAEHIAAFVRAIRQHGVWSTAMRHPPDLAATEAKLLELPALPRLQARFHWLGRGLQRDRDPERRLGHHLGSKLN